MQNDFRNAREWLENEMEIDRLRWEYAREQAEELVRDRGWSEQDDDFLFQVEDEAKRLWDEESERQYLKNCPYEDLRLQDEQDKIRT